MHVPELVELESLRALATDILKPNAGQRVMIIVCSDDEAEAMMEAPPARDNVTPLHGGPVMSGAEKRYADRQGTAVLLHHYAEMAERGEIRHAIVIAGVETNETNMGEVTTGLSIDCEEHLPLFLGGLKLGEQHLMDVYEGIVDMIEDEE